MSKTLEKYSGRVREVFEHLDGLHENSALSSSGRTQGARARYWWNSMHGATDLIPVSLKSWIGNHDLINTLQVSFDDNGKICRVWSPGMRELTVHASYVSLAGSRRYYAGVVHVAHSSNAWLGYDISANTLIVYAVV